MLARISWLDKETGERQELAEQQLMDVREIAVREGIVYWVLSDESISSRLHSAPRDQPPSFDAQAVRSNAVYLPFDLADDRVIWHEARAKELRISPLRGGPGERLTTTSFSVAALMVAGDDAYWIETTINMVSAVERHLFRIPLTGGEVSEPLAGLTPASSG